MGASVRTFAGTMLAAMSFVLIGPVSAFEPVQPGLVGSDPQAFSFPVFLDHDRLPLLLAAWDSYEHVSQERSEIEPQPTVTAGQDDEQAASDISSVAARALAQRAERATRNAAVVRRRAEELSRRFGADETPGVVAVTASVDKKASAKQQQQPKQVILRSLEQSAGVASSTSPQPTASEKIAETRVAPQDDPVDAPIQTAKAESPDLEDTKLRLAAPLPRTPPMPRRRSAPAAYDPPPKPEVKAVPRTRPSRASRTVRVPNRTADDNGNTLSSYLPTQLRSFGWNTQPD